MKRHKICISMGDKTSERILSEETEYYVIFLAGAEYYVIFVLGEQKNHGTKYYATPATKIARKLQRVDAAFRENSAFLDTLSVKQKKFL